MKHYTTRFSVSQLALLILLWNLSLIESVYGQLDVEFTPKNCDVEIKSTFDFDEIDDSVLEVTSVGVFYRLDNIDPVQTGSPAIGSYFWSEIIRKNVPTEPRILAIPPGKYRVTYYITRKGGPIKTGLVADPGGQDLTVTYGNCSNPPQEMPLSINYFVNDREKLAFSLIPSWQIGTDPKYYSPIDEHYTKAPVQTPVEPWLFLTLVARDWNTNDRTIQIAYDSLALKYAGAIADNIYSMQGGGWNYVNQVQVNNDGVVVVTPKARPDNGQTILHLLFEQRDKSLETLEQTEFFALMTSQAGNVQESSTKVEVKGAPHDPNNLKVDQDTLCPCQAEEWLTYEVRFQNLGSDTAVDVSISFLNYEGLVLPTLDMPVDRTIKRNKQIQYDTVSATFVINGISLPGLKENNVDEEDTWEKFKFKIKKQDCLAAGTLIQPKVGIVFIGDQVQDTIYTNLEATHILDKVKRHCFCEKSYCPAPHASCPGCKKKKIWWRDCLCRILHWHWHRHKHS